MAESTTVPVITGLAVGIAFFVILSILVGTTQSIQTGNISEYNPVALHTQVMGKVGSTKYSTEYMSKLSANSIAIDDDTLNRLPRLRQALTGADRVYLSNWHSAQYDAYIMTLSRPNLELIERTLPNKEKIIHKSELAFDYGIKANVTATQILMPLLYKNTYYFVNAYYATP